MNKQRRPSQYVGPNASRSEYSQPQEELYQVSVIILEMTGALLAWYLWPLSSSGLCGVCMLVTYCSLKVNLNFRISKRGLFGMICQFLSIKT